MLGYMTFSDPSYPLTVLSGSVVIICGSVGDYPWLCGDYLGLGGGKLK
jgi:hypothetical protein